MDHGGTVAMIKARVGKAATLSHTNTHLGWYTLYLTTRRPPKGVRSVA